MTAPLNVGWSTLAEAEQSCRALGMSPVPLVFRDKRPLCKSHPSLSVKLLSEAEIRAITGTGYKYELGIVGGFGGWLAVDIDTDVENIGPALVLRFLGQPLGVVLGNPDHTGKFLYRGPWPDPDPQLLSAASNYFVRGRYLSYQEHKLNEARKIDPQSQMATGAEADRKAAEDAYTKDKETFDRLHRIWVDQHGLIRSATRERKDAAGNVVLRIEVKAAGSIIAMPPSRHKLEGISFTWANGRAPNPTIAEYTPRVTADQVQALLQEVGPAVETRVNGAETVPQEIHDGERDDTLISAAGSLRRKGFDTEEIEPALQELNRRRCNPPLPEKQVAKIAKSAGRYPAGKLEDGKDKKPSAANILLEIAGGARLYHAPDGTGFADVTVGDHVETWPVSSRGFRGWLRHAYYQQTGGAPTSEAMQAAMGVIEARSQYDGHEQETYLRVAAHDGRHYLDLCDAGWRAIEIDANGWRIVDSRQIPVRFRRTSGMLALPEPVRGGSVNELRPFLNVSDNNFVLGVAWVLATLRGEGQRPVLALHGPHGSAKTTTADILRRLTDPSTAQLRALPRTLPSQLIQLNQEWGNNNGANHVPQEPRAPSIPERCRRVKDSHRSCATGGGDRTCDTDGGKKTDNAAQITQAERPNEPAVQQPGDEYSFAGIADALKYRGCEAPVIQQVRCNRSEQYPYHHHQTSTPT